MVLLLTHSLLLVQLLLETQLILMLLLMQTPMLGIEELKSPI
jgi:hypothetical protein